MIGILKGLMSSNTERGGWMIGLAVGIMAFCDHAGAECASALLAGGAVPWYCASCKVAAGVLGMLGIGVGVHGARDAARKGGE